MQTIYQNHFRHIRWEFDLIPYQIPHRRILLKGNIKRLARLHVRWQKFPKAVVDLDRYRDHANFLSDRCQVSGVRCQKNSWKAGKLGCLKAQRLHASGLPASQPSSLQAISELPDTRHLKPK